MRALLSACLAWFLLLPGFCIPWGLLVVRPGPQELWLSHLLGVSIWFGIYMLPATMLTAVLVVWPCERYLTGKLTPRVRLGVRMFAWCCVSGVYVLFVAAGNPSLVWAAIPCAAIAALLASVAYVWIVDERPSVAV